MDTSNSAKVELLRRDAHTPTEIAEMFKVFAPEISEPMIEFGMHSVMGSALSIVIGLSYAINVIQQADEKDPGSVDPESLLQAIVLENLWHANDMRVALGEVKPEAGELLHRSRALAEVLPGISGAADSPHLGRFVREQLGRDLSSAAEATKPEPTAY